MSPEYLSDTVRPTSTHAVAHTQDIRQITKDGIFTLEIVLVACKDRIGALVSSHIVANPRWISTYRSGIVEWSSVRVAKCQGPKFREVGMN